MPISLRDAEEGKGGAGEPHLQLTDREFVWEGSGWARMDGQLFGLNLVATRFAIFRVGMQKCRQSE